MKDQFSKRETSFLQRLAAFMLAAFMLIGFFPTNASALSQEIKVHQAEGDFIELMYGVSYSNTNDNEIHYSVNYNYQYNYGESAVHKYTGDNYTVGAVLYGNTGIGFEQISWISSELGGNYFDSGYFNMYFPKSYNYSSYKLVIGMADISTAANGMPFTEIYATNTYVFKMGQRINEGESGASEVEEKTVSLDLYQPLWLDEITSISKVDATSVFSICDTTFWGVLIVPISSGSGTFRIVDGNGKTYQLNYTISNNVYTGTSITDKTVNMSFGDKYSFLEDLPSGERILFNFKDDYTSNYDKLQYQPSSKILSNYGCDHSRDEYRAVGIGSTKYIHTLWSADTGKIYIYRYSINVSNEGVMNVELSPSTMYLRTGDTYQLNIKKTFPDNADDITLGTSYSLSSNSPLIATVDDSGLVTAVGKGNTGIVCTTTQGLSDRAYVYVDYDADVYQYSSRVVELDKGSSYNAPIKNFYDSGSADYYDFVNILSEKNYNPIAASSSAGYITALNNGISTFKYVCGFNYNNDDTYYAPGVVTSKVQKEYIIKVGSTSGTDGNTDDDANKPNSPSYSNSETPTYIQPTISSDTISDDSKEVTIKNSTDLDIAYFKINTNDLEGSLQIRISQTREASMRASGLIYDYAQSVGAKNYAYYPVNIDLYNTETKEAVHSLADNAKITFYITVPKEMLPLKNRLKVFHINSNNEMEMLESRITRKGGSICVRFDMDEFSPVALYVDDLTDEQFEEISAAAGYVTSKDEVVYVDYVGSGAGLVNTGIFSMDRSEQIAVCICAAVMLTLVVFVSAAAGKKSRK